MGINARPTLDPRLTRHVALPLSLFQKCIVQILDMNTTTALENFDVYTNTGTSDVQVVWQGEAQFSVSRQTLNGVEAVGAVTQIRSVTFELPTGSTGPQFAITKGMQLRVPVSPDNPTICEYQYTVTSGLNQDTPFARTIEAEADLGVTIPVPALI